MKIVTLPPFIVQESQTWCVRWITALCRRSPSETLFELVNNLGLKWGCNIGYHSLVVNVGVESRCYIWTRGFRKGEREEGCRWNKKGCGRAALVVELSGITSLVVVEPSGKADLVYRRVVGLLEMLRVINKKCRGSHLNSKRVIWTKAIVVRVGVRL